MNRWMTAVVVAAGGGALIAMSAAHAAAFTPTPSTTAAVPASELGVTAPVAGQLQQTVSGEHSLMMKLHDWLATLVGGPIYVQTGAGAAQAMQHREELMLDPSQPTVGGGVYQVFVDPCPKLFATCATQVLYIGKLKGYDLVAGTTQGLAHAHPGEQSLDVTDPQM